MHKILFGILLAVTSLAQAGSGFVFSNEPGDYAVGLRIVQQYMQKQDADFQLVERLKVLNAGVSKAPAG